MRKPWKPGDLCPKCNEPVNTQADRYKRDKNTCKPCGNKAKQEERNEERAPPATPCRDCHMPMLDGNDRRYGVCKACRQQQRVRYCECGGEIRAGSKAVRCAECSARRRATGARKGRTVAAEKRNGQRELREATRGPVEIAPRPVAQAWPGLRGPGMAAHQQPRVYQKPPESQKMQRMSRAEKREVEVLPVLDTEAERARVAEMLERARVARMATPVQSRWERDSLWS